MRLGRAIEALVSLSKSKVVDDEAQASSLIVNGLSVQGVPKIAILQM